MASLSTLEESSHVGQRSGSGEDEHGVTGLEHRGPLGNEVLTLARDQDDERSVGETEFDQPPPDD